MVDKVSDALVVDLCVVVGSSMVVLLSVEDVVSLVGVAFVVCSEVEVLSLTVVDVCFLVCSEVEDSPVDVAFVICTEVEVLSLVVVDVVFLVCSEVEELSVAVVEVGFSE
jgi:hypothetical protein